MNEQKVKDALSGLLVADHEGDVVECVFDLCNALDLPTPEFDWDDGWYYFEWDERD